MPRTLIASLFAFLPVVVNAQPSDSFSKAIESLPESESPIELFNGKDLSGWLGDPNRWSVVDGAIRGANDNQVSSSTYLFTEKPYRNFRLLLEVRQTVGKEYSTMHSAVCALGERFTDKGDNAFGFKGPLFMFCNDWGIWDAYRRNRVVDRGQGPVIENRGAWNLIEILVTGNRIQFAANGTTIFDFTDNPKMLRKSPVGLQLHSNKRAQEYHFRGLVLTENPVSRLVTARPSWRQKPEIQQAAERGSTAEQSIAETQAITASELLAGPAPLWVWGEDNQTNYTIGTTFEVKDVESARLVASCDNVGSVFLNGKQVASSDNWSDAMVAGVTQAIVPGTNRLEAQIANQGGIAAFVLKLALKDSSGNVRHVVSDEDWTIQAKNLSNGRKVTVRGKYGDGPWGHVFDSMSAQAGRVPRGVFEVLPGYQVEKLFTVPKEELGSWVCIAFDNKGRLLASDQGGKGICRITPAEVGGASQKSETVVEHLDFSSCLYQPSGAQGMLNAFDSLYFCCNGGPGSGLYRARDTDGDDVYDECVRLKRFHGGGEHGPHSLRLSPDGKSIFVIAGNHTDPPFRSGEDLTSEEFSSRIPTNWGEDLLLPRMWDANGHARGKLAPGGWIASTDPDGQTWEMFSVGYRNPYDMAFNASGDLFAYDADMEWDVGSPWYRPTRVVHATSGSEFGWRSGTGKWPEYYIDSLPPLVEIGPGSPVGVDFGYGLKFPSDYQRALFICDWTFGTMYAVHIKPQDSSYTATKEEFVSRSPLPLTDCVAGPDGALYFTIGGRGAQSELYRITYVGKESTDAVDLTPRDAFVDIRALRHRIEQTHNRDQPLASIAGIVSDINPEAIKSDRALTYAIRNSVVHNDFAPVVRQALESGRKARSVAELASHILVGSRVATLPDAQDFDKAQTRAKFLDWIPAFEDLQASPVSDQLDLIRAVGICCIRLGEPTEQEKRNLLDRFERAYPAEDGRLNRELCQLLVYLDSNSVVPKTIDLMNAPPTREEIDMGDLLIRNAGYGRAINKMIANQPDKLQVWYAFCLRVAKQGWTPSLRADYYRWFGRAQKWSGGNSFRKFLQNIESEAWETTPFDHRVLVEATGARTPYAVPVLPKPAGPGKKWSLKEVRTLALDGLQGRDFANGEKMFAAARCVVCHRFNGDGGATGPDLTQLAGRFNNDALTEAIIDPGKVISDQYRASLIVTVSGKTLTGRIVSENRKQISILTDPEDSTKIVDVAREDIDELQPSKVSIMPTGLLDQLNEDEVLDLLAYLLSRGDSRSPMFR